MIENSWISSFLCDAYHIVSDVFNNIDEINSKIDKARENM